MCRTFPAVRCRRSYKEGTWENIPGTDRLGRDYLSRLIHGARVSLLIGFSVVLISGISGTTPGLLAGCFGGKVDTFVTFIVTVRLAMPVIPVALFGGSMWVVIAVLGPLKWDPLRRGRPLHHAADPGADYIAFARATGASI